MTGIKSTESCTLRHNVRASEKGAMSSRGIALARLMMISGLLLSIAACSGGGFNPGNGNSVNAVVLGGTGGAGGGGAGGDAIMNVNTGTNETYVRIRFSVAGTSGTPITIVPKFYEDLNSDGMQDTNEPSVVMTEVPASAIDNVLIFPSTAGMQTIPGSGTYDGEFYWDAGADLGFLGANYGVVICVTIDGQNDPVAPAESTGMRSFAAGAGSSANTGTIGAGGNAGGRAAHTAHLVSGLNAGSSATDMGAEVLSVGGMSSTGPLPNIDRFSVDVANQTNMASGNFLATATARVKHASAMFLATTGSDTNVRVLVTGGEVGGASVATAEVYSFGPSGAEMVTGTMANMTVARRDHAACWLPDNRILITGGIDAAGATLASSEIYDPATGAFSLITGSALTARSGHTHCLLPDGTVLVAGGVNGAASAGNAFIFDPRTNVFTDTGTSIDRVGHTASLLVNGICALSGGQTAAGATLSTVDFYRPFSGTDTATGGTFAAGFTTPMKATGGLVQMGSARTSHATSRLGDGRLLVSGGFGAAGSTLSTAEIFVPSKFTDNAIGCFTLANPSMDPAFDMVNDRALHTQTTLQDGSAALVGGVSGTAGMNTVLDTIEVFQFANTRPVVSNLTLTSSSASNVLIKFDLADAENDCSFVIVRFSVNGGAYGFANLVDYQETVNLAPGSVSIRWNAAVDGVSSGNMVTVEVIPVGGSMGALVRSAATTIN